MTRFGRRRRAASAAALVAASAVAVGIAGCAAGSATRSASSDELVVFAAASLGDVLERLEAEYEAVGDVELTISTDSSAALRRQIEQGAPADLLLSADTENPAALEVAGLASAVVPFARNELAIVVPVDNPAGIGSPADLGKPGVRIVAAGPEVPITRYAQELLAGLETTSGYPASLSRDYQRNVVSREDNVRAVLAKVELGEADAAIVYASDALGSTDVRTVAIPPDANVAATYAAAIVDGERSRAADAFAAWLLEAEAQAILGDSGFLAP